MRTAAFITYTPGNRPLALQKTVLLVFLAFSFPLRRCPRTHSASYAVCSPSALPPRCTLPPFPLHHTNVVTHAASPRNSTSYSHPRTARLATIIRWEHSETLHVFATRQEHLSRHSTFQSLLSFHGASLSCLGGSRVHHHHHPLCQPHFLPS